ncbi:MAG: hypothetical protein AB1586_23875 [Pseudomonadota bacterium]|jgi:hypothetical protein
MSLRNLVGARLAAAGSALSVIVLAATCACGAAPVTAAEIDTALTQANELGLLRYCRHHGHLDDAAVALKERMLRQIETGHRRQLTAAEARGARGIRALMGIEQSLAGLSPDHLRTICRSMHDLDAAIAMRMGIAP